jgi:integrase
MNNNYRKGVVRQAPGRYDIELPEHKRNLTLGEYVEVYLAERRAQERYREEVRLKCAVFIDWLGSDPLISKLDCAIVNRWLSALLCTKLSPQTIDSYRRVLRAVWRFAYLEGDNDNPPDRVKKIRVPRKEIVAFRHDEILKLLETADAIQGYFPVNGVRQSVFWRALILSAYSTGLRRGDLLRVTKQQIDRNGRVVIVQQKTGFRVACQFSPEALATIHKIDVVEDDRALPWPFHENALPRRFRRLVQDAGVNRGSFHWIRRSAGSYAEREEPGAGGRVLGHRPRFTVFAGHYFDESIAIAKPTAPPRLPRERKRRVERVRRPPTVRIVQHKAGRMYLIYRDAVTKKVVSVATRTRDKATALGQKAALEERLRREMQERVG